MAADVGSGERARYTLGRARAAARRHGTWLLVAGSFRLCGAVRPLLRERREELVVRKSEESELESKTLREGG